MVSWPPAVDASPVSYLVYFAAVPGGQDFLNPVVTTAPGETSATIDGLSPGMFTYWVVRAVDAAGNQETNVVEVFAATTLVS